MKKITQLTLFFVILASLSLFSCKTVMVDPDPNPKLEVSEKTLNFSKVADEKSITITVNEKDEYFHTITSASGTDWISVTKTETGINVSVIDNTTEDPREATIKVGLLKGNLTETIKVTQGDGSYISASEEAITFKDKGGTKTLYIECSSDWTYNVELIDPVEGEEEWLIIDDSEATKNKLTITTPSTKSEDHKYAKITLTNVGQEIIEVTVTRYGVQSYAFPLLELGYIYEGTKKGLRFPTSLTNAYAFEKERGNIFKEIWFYRHVFDTKDPVLSRVTYDVYQFYGWGVNAVKAVHVEDMDRTRNFTLQNDPKLLAYIRNQGFILAWKGGTPDTVATYWNKNTQVALQVNYPTATNYPKGFAFIHSKFRPNSPNNQVDPFPTFATIPVSFMEIGGTAAQITAWEAAAGSTLIPEESSPEQLAFTPDPNKEPDFAERVYFMVDGALDKAMILTNHAEKTVYQTGHFIESAGYQYTREFAALLKNEGYEFSHSFASPTSFVFKNEVKGLYYVLQLQRFESEQAFPRMCIIIQKSQVTPSPTT